MRLSELHPEWHTDGCETGTAWLKFDCPHCRAPRFVQVFVRVGPDRGVQSEWSWNGETDFERVTLQPSLNDPTHWHGHVTNGEITFCSDSPPIKQ